MSGGQPYVLVAIDGRGGSGKTTLATFLAGAIPDTTLVHTDDFARPGVPGWEWARFRSQVIEPILEGRAGRYQRYDWDEDRLAEWHDVPPEGVVIVEGVSSTRTELDVPWDLTVWVDTPKDVRLARGIARDGEGMRPQWENVWEPQEDQYVLDQQPESRADITVGGSSDELPAIRPEDQADFPAIDELVRAAFGSDVEPRLVKLIRESPGYIRELSLVAEIDGTVVGHVMLSRLELDDGAERHPALTLSPLAVAPAFQKRGVGSALVSAVISAADRRSEPLVVLEGGPGYYSRLGFQPAADLGISIDLPSWAPPEAAQAMPLSNYDPTIRGKVVYPSAFAEAERDS